LKEQSTPIFRVEEKAKREAIVKQLASRALKKPIEVDGKLRKPFPATKIKFLRLMAEFIFLFFKRDIP
jgi:hypothetical protein